MKSYMYRDYEIVVHEKPLNKTDKKIYSCEIYSPDGEKAVWRDASWHGSSERAEEIAKGIVSYRFDRTYEYQTALGIDDGGIHLHRSLAVSKEALETMIETQQIDRSSLLTPEDIVWLREWLPKLATDSELEYKIHVYPPRSK